MSKESKQQLQDAFSLEQKVAALERKLDGLEYIVNRELGLDLSKLGVIKDDLEVTVKSPIINMILKKLGLRRFYQEATIMWQEEENEK